MADLDCSSGLIILGVITAVHVILSLGLLGCIIWCACCYRKKQLRIRPLSPKHPYRSPNHRISSPDENNQQDCTISNPTVNQRELKHLKLISQLEAKRLQTISESTVASSDNESVTTTSVTIKDTSFTMNTSNRPNGKKNAGDSSPIFKNTRAWEEKGDNKDSVSDGSHGDSSSNNESVFTNPDAEEKASVSAKGPSATENWKREVVLARRKAKRSNSTRPLLMSSISSDIGGSVSEDISGSCMSLPAADGSPPMRVLTRHAGSRKKLNGSMKSLVGGSDDYERNCSTLPRMHRLPPITTPRPLSTTPLSPLQTLSENIPLATESVTNLTTIERPRPNRQSSEEENLPRLSLHLAHDMGLEPNENKYRSIV